MTPFLAEFQLIEVNLLSAKKTIGTGTTFKANIYREQSKQCLHTVRVSAVAIGFLGTEVMQTKTDFRNKVQEKQSSVRISRFSRAELSKMRTLHCCQFNFFFM